MKNNLLVIALLVAFASCKKDDASKYTTINTSVLGEYSCSYTGGKAGQITSGLGTLKLSSTNGEYYLKSTYGANFWHVIDSAKVTITDNVLFIPTKVQDTIVGYDLTAYIVINGSGTITDSTLSMHYTVDQYQQSGTKHDLFVYDLTGTK